MIIPIVIVVLFVGFGAVAGVIVSKKSQVAHDDATTSGTENKEITDTAPVEKVDATDQNNDNGAVAGVETEYNGDMNNDANSQDYDGFGTGNSGQNKNNEDSDGFGNVTLPSNTNNTNSDYDGISTGDTETNTNSTNNTQSGNVKTSVTVVDNDDYSGFAQ